jgi:hypothetical protein
MVGDSTYEDETMSALIWSPISTGSVITIMLTAFLLILALEGHGPFYWMLVVVFAGAWFGSLAILYYWWTA